MGQPRSRTSQTHARPHDAATLTAIAGLLLVAGTACTSTRPTPPTESATIAAPASATPQPATARAPKLDAQQVCTGFVTMALSVNARTDSGPGEARRRAALHFGIPGLALQIGAEGRDTTWALLETHQAHVNVATEPVGDDPPPARGGVTGAAVHVTRTAVAPGWTQPLDPLVAYCSLRREDRGWVVTGITFSASIHHGTGG